jgi:histidinol-phosphate aminotransferase
VNPPDRGDTWQVPIRPEFAHLQPYGAPQLDVPVTLNVNENPFSPPDEVVDDIATEVAAAAAKLNRYPDRDAVTLRAGLAAYLGHGLNAENIWAANGSNEVMLHILQAFGGPQRTMMTFPPTYSMYPEYARDTHTDLVEVPRSADFSIDTGQVLAAIDDTQPDVIVIASPNNPTGTAVTTEFLTAVLAAAPGIVVVDEAYAEFARPQSLQALTLLDTHPHLVVVRTMSKAFALAGARVGYAAADPRIIRALQVVRLPYHLSAITQASAVAALRHSDALLGQVAHLRAARDEMVTWLNNLELTTAESDANFILFGVFDDRHAIWQGLLDRGVLIRETGPDGWLRVSIGTPSENEQFKQALQQVLVETGSGPDLPGKEQ